MNKLLNLLELRKENKLFNAAYAANEVEQETENNNDTVFITDLRQMIKNNGTWFTVLFILTVAIIILLCYLVYSFKGDQKYVFALLGSGSSGIVLFIYVLISLYNKKNTVEIMLYMYTASKSVVERKKTLEALISYLKSKGKPGYN